MPRDERIGTPTLSVPSPCEGVGNGAASPAGRRAFLRACAAAGAAAGLPALGCSGPQDLPHGPPPIAPQVASASPAPAAPLDGGAAPTPALAALRDYAISDGLEPATVFCAALEGR
jgi:hypothetical protein